jgi:hypothetical protein
MTDMRSAGWYARIKLSGQSHPYTAAGSMTQVMGAMLEQMRKTSPRNGRDGVKRITIEIASAPLEAQDREFQELVGSFESLAQGVTSQDYLREPNEPVSAYLARLESLGYDVVTAATLGADQYSGDSLVQLQLITAAHFEWMRDPLAERLRVMSASDTSFESALPGEYAKALRHCVTQYPEFVKRMKLRMAI